MNKVEFFSALRVTDSGCHEWTRAKNSRGYGYLRFDGRDVRAHRLAFEFAFGNFAERLGLFVLHKCDNPACCNPEHLFAGTHVENMRDMRSKGRSLNQSGSRNHYARLTEDAVKRIREMRSSGSPVALIAGHFNVHQTTVSKVITRATWRHI